MAERKRTPWRDLPQVDRVIYATPKQAPSDAAREWARTLLATNTEALAALEPTPQGNCRLCGEHGFVYWEDPKVGDGPDLCALCLRGVVDWRDNPTLCDNDPSHGKAWRNPFTRRNEYFCGACHARTPEGVVQNRWARAGDSTEARISLPLGVRERELCEAKGVPGTKPCQGQVKPRGTSGAALCDYHAGKLRR